MHTINFKRLLNAVSVLVILVQLSSPMALAAPRLGNANAPAYGEPSAWSLGDLFSVWLPDREAVDTSLPARESADDKARLPARVFDAQDAPQCPPESDLSIDLTIPPYRVSEGNTAGDVYTVTVSNSGTVSATEVSLLVDPNTGFYYVGGSATVSSNLDNPTLTDPGTTVADSPFSLVLNGPAPLNALEPGETLTFTFKLATTDNAPSSQLLTVSLQSGSPTAQTCISTQENVPTGRGNLTLVKGSPLQNASVGDVVTWTIGLKNTGLGWVYGAVITDTFGSALANTQITPSPAPVDLNVGETFIYTATGVVASCGNLTNRAQAAWSIGNEDGTATGSNPLQADADIKLLLDDPNLAVQVGPLPQVLYCGSFTTTVPVTVTNTGGAAQQLVLDISATGLTVSNPQPSSDWTLSGSQLIYSGGVVPGMIRGGETITLTLDVSTPGPVCSGGTASLQLTPRAYDACMLLLTTGTAGQSSTTLGADAPTLSMTKDASTGDIAYSGETFVYTVTLAGTNITNTNGITVTDVLTDFLQNVSAGASAGTVTQNRNAITWTLPATNAILTETLLITATIPDQSPLGCDKGRILDNTAQAVASVCPQCSLTAQANDEMTVLDSLSYGVNDFSMESSPIAMCSTDYSVQQFTTTLHVRTGITWTNSIFTDTLGAGVFDAAYNVVPGSLQVLIDGVDRTGILTYTLGPPLVIDFGGMSAISPYSDTADIVIHYEAEAGPTTLLTDPSRTGFVEAYFDVNGPAQACDGNAVGVLGTDVTIRRGNLGIGLSPNVLDSCHENDVTISVTGGSPNPDLRTDHLVVTFTAQAGDVYTPTAATFGGALAGIPVTVTQTGITTTFEFSPTAPITGDGSITLPLYRPCGVSGPLTSNLTYQDLCSVTRGAGPATAGQTTRSAQVSLYVTPDEYTVYERSASWRWYVSNMGDMAATNATVTNTLPAGYHFVTYTASTQYTPTTFLSTIGFVTGTVGGREVVTFTIGTLPTGARVRFDVQASIASCADPAQVDIGLTIPCGLVENASSVTCSGTATDRVIFHKGPTALLSSNYQDANIPLCQSGIVRLEVKNASLQSDEHDFVITDTLTNVAFVSGTSFVTVTNASGSVVTGATSGQPLANVPFTPTVTSISGGEVLEWDGSAFASGTPQYDVLAQRDGEDVITIEFVIQSSCASTDSAVQSAATARDICDVPLSTTEDSMSLLVDTPDLGVSKVAGNLTAPSGNTSSEYPNRIYASVGDSVAFTITVDNSGDAPVTNLFVTDTLPANIQVSSVSTGGNVGTGTVDWGTGGGLTLGVGESKTFIITGTVTNAVCSLDGINEAQASYGCSTSDICLSTPVTDTATVQTVPVISVQSITGDLLTCGGDITIVLQNDGPPAQSVVLTDTLPTPFVYDSGVSSTTAPVTSPASGDNPAVWTWSSLPTGQTTLVFHVRTSSAGGACAVPSSPVADQVDVSYTDSCNTTPPYTTTQSANLAVEAPDLLVTKTPSRQTSDVGSVVTWTIAVQNVGTAIAPNIQVTDTLDSSFVSPSATDGTGGNESTSAVVAGNVITWTPAFTLPVGGVWTAQVSAQLQATGQNTNTVQAVGSCGTGCVYDSESASAHTTLLAQFDKGPDAQTRTIGSETLFTFTAHLTDQDALYSNLTITDALPVGLGYLSSVVTMTYDIDGSSSGPTTTVFSSPSVLPSVTTPPSGHPSGNIVWNLGNVPGTADITGTVRAVVQDIAFNQQGVVLTNNLDMTYVDDGNLYAYHDSGDVTLLEPTLVLEKEAWPTNTQPGATVFYTLTLYHDPTSTIPAYNVRVTDTVPADLHYVPGSLQVIPAGIGTSDDLNSPQLLASFNVISPTYTAGNPIRLRYAATVDQNAPYGSAYTNTATLTWTSLPTDTYQETRDGSGGIDDYLRQASAVVSLNSVGVEKTAPLSVTAGNTIVYTVTVVNVGPDPATNTIVTDTMPFQVDTTSATYSVPGGGSGSCIITPNANGDVVVCSLGTVPANVTATILVTATVPPDVPEGADLTNSAHMTAVGPDGEVVDGTAQAETEVYTQADLSVTKDCPPTAVAGETVECTVTVTNSGPSTARDVDVKDVLPAGLTWVSGTPSQGACVAGICQFGDVSAGATVTAVLTIGVGSDVLGDVTNTVQVFSDTPDPNPANDTASATVTVSALAALQIDKTDLTDPVYAGDTYLYEIVVTNTGPSTAQGVIVTDTLPSQVSVEGASPECTSSGGVVTCILGSMLPESSRDLLVNVRVADDVISGTVGTNTATVTTSTPVDTGNSVLSDSETTTYLQKTGQPTDLQIDKSVAPTTAVAGSGRFTYTLTVANNGPAPASAVQVVDALPPEFMFVSATASSGSVCNAGVTCDLGEMAVGDEVTITIVAAVPSDVASGTYTNTASVGSASPDGNQANNEASAQTTVTRYAALDVRKGSNPSTATPGESLSYTIVVTNTGPSDADNVTVADTLPSGFTPVLIVSSQGGCSALPCNLGTLAAGANASITIHGEVDSDVTSDLQNTATVTSTTPGTGDSDTIVTPLAGSADLSLVKSATPTAQAGQSITYTLTVYNLGPSDASGVLITDTLPAGVAIQSAGGCADNGDGTITCDVGTLAAGASQSFVITVLADDDIEPGTSLENRAVVGSDTPDGDPSNNQAYADTSIVGLADLSLSKIGPSSVTAGQQVTYTIVVTNAGPSVAQSVDVKDALPSNVALDSATVQRSGSGLSACGGTVCQVGDMAVGEVVTITVVGTVDASVPGGTVLTNTATVFSDSPDPDTNDRTDTATTTVATSADVSVTKVDLTDPVAPTEGFMYQIVVANAGPSDAQNVVVTDTLDANVSFASASSGCTLSGSEVVCDVGTLASGSSQSYLIAVNAGDVVSGTVLSNVVAATSTTPDPNAANNTDSVTTTVQQKFGPSADLAIVKSTNQASVTAGERITYTLTVTNAGPATATNVRVLELVPAGTTAISLTPNNPDYTGEFCSLGGSCYLGTVYTSTTATIQVVLQVDSDFGGSSLVNQAHVSADQQDPNTANNFSETTTPVNTSADLSIAKSDMVDPVLAGDTLQYQIVITNNGPSDAQNVVVTDTLDSNTTFTGASPECAESAGVVTCTLSSLAAGASRSFFVEVRVSDTLPDPTTLTNLAGVTAATSDPNPANNNTSETTLVHQPSGGPADLAIAKTDNPDPIIAGSTLTYTLVVTNNGPSVAHNVLVVDALPTGVSLVSATPTQGLCNAGITCDLGDIAVGGTVSIVVVVTVDSGQTTDITNYARVSAANPDPTPANNEASQPTVVDESADLRISKSASPATATPGSSLSYEIVVVNDGPSDAQNVQVLDALPGQLLGVTFSASQGSCAGALCNLGTLAAGNSATISVIGTVAADASSPFTNTVSVLSSTPDPDTTNNLASVTTPVQPSADLVLDVSSTPTVNAGESVVVTYTVTNNGPSDASNTVVIATFPDGVSAPSGWTLVSGDVYTRSLGTVTAGSTSVVTAVVTTDANLEPGTSLQFDGEVGSDVADPDLTNNSDDADTSVVGLADLSVTKDCPPTAVAGETVECTVMVTNSGPSTARDVDVKDILPAGLTWVSGTPSQGACVAGICQFGDVSAGATVTAVLTIGVGSDVLGDVTNTVQVFSDTPDPNGVNNTSIATFTVGALADLSIEKTASPDPAVPGDDLTYEIAVANGGPSDAQNVVVSDTLPSGFTLTSVSSSQGGCTAMPCALGTIPAGSSAMVTLVGEVSSDATGTLTNTATVTATTADPDAGNNGATITTTLSPRADLVLDLTSTPTANAGETAVVTATVTNDGPSTAAGAVVTLTLPLGTTFDSASMPAGWSAVDNGDGTVTLSTGDSIVPEESTTLSVTVDIADGVLAGTSLEFDGVVSSDTPDPTPSNNADNADTSILGVAELRVDKRTISGTVMTGSIITYTILVENIGPSTARQVQMVDALPGSLTLVSVSTTQGLCAGTICFLGDMAAGSAVTVTLRARVGSDVPDGTVISNAAIVSSPTPDPGAYPNYDWVSNEVQALASLSITKDDMSDPVSAGDMLIYHIAVANSGPGDAENVVVTDTLPSGLTYQSSTDSCAETSPGTLTCDLGTLAAGTTRDFLVTTLVDTGIVSGTHLVNTATVTSTTPLTNSVLSDQETTLVQQALGTPADLQIEKVASSDVVTAGTTVTYTMLITNAGPGTALDVDVVDSLPSGLTLLSATSSQGLCNGGTCSLGTMPFGGTPTTATIQIVALASPGLPEGTALANTAFVQSDQPDPTPGNNVDGATVSVATSADLSVSKTDHTDPVPAGSVLTYTIAITNAGPSDAVSVIITDHLPSGTTFVGGSGCGESGGVVTCAMGALPAGATGFLVLGVQVPPDASGTMTNTVDVSSSTSDPDPANNHDSETTDVRRVADLLLTKRAERNAVIAGHLMTYTLSVYNGGPSLAQNVTVTDTLPGEVSFVSADPVQSSGPNPLVWSLPDMSPGASQEITLVVRASEDITPSALIVNSAVVGSSAYDPAPENNHGRSTVQAFTQADIEVHKGTGSSVAYIGSRVVYTMTVHNRGPSGALDVDLKDLLPRGMQMVSAETSQGECVSNICQLGEVPVSTTVEITAVVDVDNDVPEGTWLCNKAAVFQDTPDPDATNNRDTVCLVAHRLSDLSIEKTASATEAVVGDVITYTVSVTNKGPSPAEGVVVADTLPISSTYVTSSDDCVLMPGNQLRCHLGSMGVLETRTFFVVVRANNDADNPFFNSVTVTALGDPDPTPWDNEDSVYVLIRRPDMTATKSVVLWNDADGNGHGSAGDTLRYTVVITNSGDGVARGIVYDDTPDPHTLLVTGSVTTTQGTIVMGNGPGDTSIQVDVGDVAPGHTVTIVYDVVIQEIVATGPVDIANQGYAGGTNIDGLVTDDPSVAGAGDPTIFVVSDVETPTPTPTPLPNPMYIPIVLKPLPACEVAYVQTVIWGHRYVFPLKPDGNVKFIPPPPWSEPTTFRIVGYDGPVTWTQYEPTYRRQVGGYEFVYPGGHAGETFRLFVKTTCGTVVIESSVDDPTATPTPAAAPAPASAPTPTPEPLRLYVPVVGK